MATSFFSVLINGQIESGHFASYDNIYLKFSFVHGPDWAVVAGVEEGITQQSLSNLFFSRGDPRKAGCVWNFPIDLAFKSTNAYGWPQMLMTVYGPDLLGRDVVRGYGVVRVPRVPGIHTLEVPMFVPLASTTLNGFLSWASGRLPEFRDVRFIAGNEGREVTTVRSQGIVKVTLNVGTKDMERFGYVVRSLTGK
ncbi:B9 domain-containing protein 1 [Fimicolochytrium jonesii]|uniref:B9 domain-containing protein 1 n=1 Tax=Fimicolochytrium jonesii TaxID=1396493 RepID=UPI0022FF3987|nr:B9 domain-containing protein 1 [Fimicolochytrium jonesii]KAI8818193.1 B9 domain-containing protein 1 [Fimicolochytrium jonesii]